MEMKGLMLICVGINIMGVLLSAFFWNKQPQLRLSPVFASIVSGIVFILINPEVSGFVDSSKLLGISLFIGLGFYFSVWIQCKD